MNNTEMVRRLIDSIKRQMEKAGEYGINKPRATIRHLEASADDTNVRLLTSLPAYAEEAEDE